MIADITKMSPKSGRIIGEDGQVYNQVTLLNTSGVAPAVAGTYDITSYVASSGRIIGEDGKAYNLVDLFGSLPGDVSGISPIADPSTATAADVANKVNEILAALQA